MKEKCRIDWVDCAKGITILLVIVGHSVDGFARYVIYTFHMPLFFILSGLTFKYSNSLLDFRENVKKSIVRLLLPAYGTYIIAYLISLFRNGLPATLIEFIYQIKDLLIRGLFASGDKVEVFGSSVGLMGAQWFLVVLFCVRIVYDYLHLKLNGKKFLFVIICLSFVGFAVSYVQWLPFSFDIALAILPFFYIGDRLKKLDVNKNIIIKLGGYLLVWISITIVMWKLYLPNLELAIREYPMYPLCFVLAYAGTMTVSLISVLILKNNILSKFFRCCGKNSLYIMCIHILDWSLDFWRVSENPLVNLPVRICYDLAIFGIVMLIKEKINKKRNQKRKIESN